MAAPCLVMQSPDPPRPFVQSDYNKWCLIEEGPDKVSIDNGEALDWVEALAVPVIHYEQRDLALDACMAPETIFRQLVDQWHQERGASSSTTEIVLCPAYQSIIGLGTQAIPLILAEMKSEGDDPDQWFWALQFLSRENPVREEDEGNFRAMAEAWFNWARDKYLW